jgi:outer membrane protein OmpA-like peptidoglycan-associated protein
MIQQRIAKVTAFIATAFITGAAFAAEPGFYIGASAGQTTAKASTDPVLVSTPPDVFNTFHFDKDETGYKGFVGYNFVPWLGVEGGYVELGNPSQGWTVGTTRIEGEVDANGWEGFLVGTLPLGPVDIFAKVGGIAANIDLKVKASVVGQPTQHFSESDSNGMLAYGGGIAYNFGHWAIRAEYEAYDVNKLDDLYFVSGGLTYRFGGDKPKAVPVAASAPAPVAKPAPVVAAAPAKCPDADHDGVCDAVDQCPNTPAGARVGPSGCDCDYVLTLDFPFNSAELHAEDKAKIDAIIPVLKNPKVAFIAGEVDGYTDSTGEEAYNVDLSKRRAQAVADYVRSQGVNLGDRFVVQGFGEAHPVASNDTKEGRAQNRRVVLRRTDCGPAY